MSLDADILPAPDQMCPYFPRQAFIEVNQTLKYPDANLSTSPQKRLASVPGYLFACDPSHQIETHQSPLLPYSPTPHHHHHQLRLATVSTFLARLVDEAQHLRLDLEQVEFERRLADHGFHVVVVVLQLDVQDLLYGGLRVVEFALVSA